MSVIAETAELVWGYTMADVDRAARVAVRKHDYSRSLDDEDRADCAWHAVVTELYSRDDPPTFHDLLQAAFTALSREVSEHRRHHGITAEGMAPKFERYWLPVKFERTDGFSDRICETIALRDALGVLTGDQYEALSTLAAFDNAAGAAAEALGLKYHGFMYRVYSGREKIKAVWFDEETPVVSKATGDTCRVGHARGEHGRRLPDGRWECVRCKRAASRRRAARSRGEVAGDAA